VRSLRGAALLSAAGIAIAAPVAAVEVRRGGMLERSYYIAEEIPGGKTADAYWREDLKGVTGARGFRARRRSLEALGALFETLHRAGIYHNDLKDFNILIRAAGNGEQELFLLDLEGVRRYRVLSARRKVKNLVQLHRTLGKHLSRTQELAVLKSYLRVSAAPAPWVETILAASRRADALSRAKSARPAARARA
jgi:tRNA A-37 threonylcarbamoyl transferase component Bud32